MTVSDAERVLEANDAWLHDDRSHARGARVRRDQLAGDDPARVDGAATTSCSSASATEGWVAPYEKEYVRPDGYAGRRC